MDIHIEKSHVMIILGFMFLLAGGIVYAIGGSNPTVIGHSAGEIEGVCKTDGTGCEGVFQGGALIFFGKFGSILKDGVSASASVQYITGSVCFLTAYGQTRVLDGTVQTRAYVTGCSGYGNCDSGWVNGISASCSRDKGTVHGRSTATATVNGITVNGYSGSASGSWT